MTEGSDRQVNAGALNMVKSCSYSMAENQTPDVRDGDSKCVRQQISKLQHYSSNCIRVLLIIDIIYMLVNNIYKAQIYIIPQYRTLLEVILHSG